MAFIYLPSNKPTRRQISVELSCFCEIDVSLRTPSGAPDCSRVLHPTNLARGSDVVSHSDIYRDYFGVGGST